MQKATLQHNITIITVVTTDKKEKCEQNATKNSGKGSGGGEGRRGGGVPLPQGFPGHIEGPGCQKTSSNCIFGYPFYAISDQKRYAHNAHSTPQ